MSDAHYNHVSTSQSAVFKANSHYSTTRRQLTSCWLLSDVIDNSAMSLSQALNLLSILCHELVTSKLAAGYGSWGGGSNSLPTS